MADDTDIEVVIVGGGIAGGALATVLARSGRAVLLLERQATYEDRIRGEVMAPWGVAEADQIGVLDDLVSAEGAFLTRLVPYDEIWSSPQAEAATMDLSALVPGVPGRLSVGHPAACEALARAAAAAGAVVRRGVETVQVASGPSPTVSYVVQGRTETVEPRLVVGADGRGSGVRRQAGIVLRRAPRRAMGAGMLVSSADGWPSDTEAIGTEGDVHFYVFPQAGGRTRLYLEYSESDRDRFGGPERASRFLDVFGGLTCLPASARWGSVEPLGPCASHVFQDTWVDEPTVPGIVLIGDAGGYNDPITGQGLSLAMSDVRLVAEALGSAERWDPAAFADYSAERAERMRRVRFAAAFTAALYADFGPEAKHRRSEYFASLAQDPSLRLPIASTLVGPYKVPEETFTASMWNRALGSQAAPDLLVAA